MRFVEYEITHFVNSPVRFSTRVTGKMGHERGVGHSILWLSEEMTLRCTRS